MTCGLSRPNLDLNRADLWSARSLLCRCLSGDRFLNRNWPKRLTLPFADGPQKRLTEALGVSNYDANETISLAMLVRSICRNEY